MRRDPYKKYRRLNGNVAEGTLYKEVVVYKIWIKEELKH